MADLTIADCSIRNMPGDATAWIVVEDAAGGLVERTQIIPPDFEDFSISIPEQDQATWPRVIRIGIEVIGADASRVVEYATNSLGVEWLERALPDIIIQFNAVAGNYERTT